MIRRPPRSTPKPSSAASDVYKRQIKDYLDFHGNTASGWTWSPLKPQFHGHRIAMGIAVPWAPQCPPATRTPMDARFPWTCLCPYMFRKITRTTASFPRECHFQGSAPPKETAVPLVHRPACGPLCGVPREPPSRLWASPRPVDSTSSLRYLRYLRLKIEV